LLHRSAVHFETPRQPHSDLPQLYQALRHDRAGVAKPTLDNSKRVLDFVHCSGFDGGAIARPCLRGHGSDVPNHQREYQ